MANKPDEKTLNNLQNDIITTVQEAFDKVDEIHDDRDALNDRKAEIRSSLKAKSIHKEAFDMALKYRGWDADKRKGFDIAYQLCRKAMGEEFNPQQMDLFNDEKPEPQDEAA